MSGNTLDLADSEKVRALLRELLTHEGKTQISIGKAINVSQSTLSGFLSGRQGTSYPTAHRIALLAGRTLDEVLGQKLTSAERTPAPYEAAQTMARAMGFDPRFIGSWNHPIATDATASAEDMWAQMKLDYRQWSPPRDEDDVEGRARDAVEKLRDAMGADATPRKRVVSQARKAGA